MFGVDNAGHWWYVESGRTQSVTLGDTAGAAWRGGVWRGGAWRGGAGQARRGKARRG